MRIVLLTNGHAHGFRIAEGLAARGIRLHTVVYESRSTWRDCRWTRLRSRAIRNGTAGTLARYVQRRLRSRRVRLRYAEMGLRVMTVGSIYDAETLEALDQLSVDLIVLGGIGILDDRVIATARVGVLNGHPALLPWLRGVGVVARAVEQGIPVGATCHFVDGGIDTGRVIERRLLPVDGHMTSLAALEFAAEALAARVLVDVVAAWPPAVVSETGEEGARPLPICRWPDSDQTARIDQLVRDGVAGRLFRQAVEGGVREPDYVLPPAYAWSVR